MEYTSKEISEMQGLMRGAADPAVQIEILAQIYGGTADDICIALDIPLLPLKLTPNMIRHGWTEQTLITIRKMHRTGKCQREIAAAVGLSEHAIDGFFRRHRGIFPSKNEEKRAGKKENGMAKSNKYHKITTGDIARIKLLHSDGYNLTDIARLIGCSRQHVHNILFGKAKRKAASNAGTSLTAEISV